ncbi:Ran-binding protein 9 [Seminavis robusta]|uniref:Ran-binding protein 9 n=1 Tax=Seminavis robusta TaxID=568900 RepID=A0A9N8HJG2_9STRA|nr:Ran-binding protein 9 [Seminavis robusta]|eukprot:Sro858_g211860.1 Ran-binding protein 9 (713) ;mRNA; r:24816-26954
MEVLSGNNNNRGNNSNSFALSHQYHRYSSVSLASAVSEDNYSLAESFHTCYDDPAIDEEFKEAESTMTSRVASFACLEDIIMEEDVPLSLHPKSKFMSSSSSQWGNKQANGMLSHSHLPGQSIVPLRAYAQLQQQPLSPRLTAARLALSSDIGVLRRCDSSSSSPQRSNNNSPKELAKVLLDREAMSSSSAAFPMSRSFATPRMAVGTAFRYISSSGNKEEEEEKQAECLPPPPPFVTATNFSYNTTKVNKKKNKKRRPRVLQLEDLADDLQVQFLSFLPLADVRAVMATNRRYRKLLFTQDAQNLWQSWCHRYQWPQLMPTTATAQQPIMEQKKTNNGVILIDDLSLPTAARPASSAMLPEPSPWHQQANLSLLLSMAQQQPADIDQAQLHKYQTWRYANVSSSSRRRRSRLRVHTTDGNQQPLLHYEFRPEHQQWMVQFTGRVGMGDRCVRSNQPLPRPTLIQKKAWMVPPSSPQTYKLLVSPNRESDYSHRHGGSGSHGGLLDLFCRSKRAIAPPKPAWRPFVAPFVTQDKATVHLTPRFVSYYEVSIMAPPADDNDTQENMNNRRPSNVKDCVAVGVATETFDWHTRMPGWDAASFGYHGDDGGIFHSSGGMLKEFGPSFGRGDVVGCGIDHVMRGIFYTLNGKFLGYAWTDLPLEILERDMYPVVGIDTNDLIHCNFGTESFKYDLASMVVRHEEFVHQSLSFAARS